MAEMHFSAKVFGRSSGRSAAGSAAYRAGVELVDVRTGELFNYSRRKGVTDAFILAPDSAPDWVRERQTLWAAVELAEKRKDAQLSREIEIGLPLELDADRQRRLLVDFVGTQFVARGMVADVAIHSGDQKGGAQRPHAHVMLTMRGIEGGTFGKKVREWNDSGLVESWRAEWAMAANLALKAAGSDAWIDARSIAEQREKVLDLLADERDEVKRLRLEARAASLDYTPLPRLDPPAWKAMQRGAVPDALAPQVAAYRQAAASKAAAQERAASLNALADEREAEIATEAERAAQEAEEARLQAIQAEEDRKARLRAAERAREARRAEDERRKRDQALTAEIRAAAERAEERNPLPWAVEVAVGYLRGIREQSRTGLHNLAGRVLDSSVGSAFAARLTRIGLIQRRIGPARAGGFDMTRRWPELAAEDADNPAVSAAMQDELVRGITRKAPHRRPAAQADVAWAAAAAAHDPVPVLRSRAEIADEAQARLSRQHEQILEDMAHWAARAWRQAQRQHSDAAQAMARRMLRREINSGIGSRVWPDRVHARFDQLCEELFRLPELDPPAPSASPPAEPSGGVDQEKDPDPAPKPSSWDGPGM